MIELTNHFNPGDLDPARVYTHAKIVRFGMSTHDREVSLYWQYGTIDGEKQFVPGLIDEKYAAITRDDWAKYLAEYLFDGEGTGQRVLALFDQMLHRYLLDSGKIVGTLAG